MAQELSDRVAVITGGGRGIGRAVAEALASAGAAVAVLARTQSEIGDTARAIEGARGRALAYECDVLDTAALARVAASVSEDLGAVDLLVNNAGTGAAIGPTWEVDAELWWRDVEVVIRGGFNACRAFVPGMIKRRSGRVVNVTSRAGAMAVPYHTAYSCSRAAIFQLTEGLAGELAVHSVLAFALTPGTVKTALTRNILESDAGQRWLPRLKELLASGTTWVEPAAVGKAVVAIARGDADALAGRWLHTTDDFAALVASAQDIEANDRRALRLRS